GRGCGCKRSCERWGSRTPAAASLTARSGGASPTGRRSKASSRARGSMSWIERRLSALYDRIYASCSADPAALSLVRIGFGLYFLLVSPPFAKSLSGAPQGLFDPPEISVANLFDGFPPAAQFVVVDWLRLACAACLVLGIRARAAGLMFVALTVF